jgi:hypothetical protein
MTTRTAVPTKTKGKPSALDGIATSMREIVDASSARWVHRRLNHGLELVLQHTDHRWRLALGRPDVAPSDNEIEICRAAFGVPVGVEESRTTKKRTNPKTNITLEWHVVEMTWMEA